MQFYICCIKAQLYRQQLVADLVNVMILKNRINDAQPPFAIYFS